VQHCLIPCQLRRKQHESRKVVKVPERRWKKASFVSQLLWQLQAKVIEHHEPSLSQSPGEIQRNYEKFAAIMGTQVASIIIHWSCPAFAAARSNKSSRVRGAGRAGPGQLCLLRLIARFLLQLS
jgi:hypothetical protein